MSCSEITLKEAINNISVFSPVKIIFNDTVLYNDYDSKTEIEDGVFGERLTPEFAIPNRIKNFDNLFVTSVNIDIVEYHHSIVRFKGGVVCDR